MAIEVVNRDLLPRNVCFGCGHDNPDGLRIELSRDAENRERLVGRFDPPDHMIGFPGITHGGAIYTALDCMAAWAPTVLRSSTRALWILRSATMKYLRPAVQGRPLSLAAWIVQEGETWEAVTVGAEARDSDGTLLAEGRFKVIPLSPERFKEVSGLDRLPDNWKELLERDRR